METNFFEQIAGLQITGDLQIIIGKGADENMVVSVLLNNKQCGDNAKNLIAPMILRETPQELDKVFFTHITEPVKSTSNLMVNMESYLKQQELAKQHSAMEKEKVEKAKKEKEARDKRYTEIMQKVDELEKEGKYRDAWVKVPEPSLYPEHQEAIQKRRSSLASKFAPDLFAAEVPLSETNETEVQQDDYTQAEPDYESQDAQDYDDDNPDGDEEDINN